MDSLITAAANALSLGDPLAALKRVGFRDDAPALTLRGIAMAQIGDLARARDLLRSAVRAYGPAESMARARCTIAAYEIALVSRDLSWPIETFDAARTVLEEGGDRVNAAHAAYLVARRLLLIGQLDAAERRLNSLDDDALQLPSKVGYWLVAAGIAMRRIRAQAAQTALDRAARAARETGIPALISEVERAMHTFQAPAARLVWNGGERLLGLAEVEALLTSDTLIVDACHSVVRMDSELVPLATRPVLFVLLRALAEAWPEDASRQTLLRRIFRARQTNESHRARLRVEIARLRKAIKPLAAISASRRGFVLQPRETKSVAVLVPPIASEHADVLALLADGQAWSSFGLALALGVSSRTVQRALAALSEAGQAESFGRGRACRWTATQIPGFPTGLLLPVSTMDG